MNEQITVLVVEPGKTPYAKEINPGLKSLQKEVGGDIQAIYPFPEPVAIVCNETAKLDGLPLNRALRDDAGEIYDIIAGTFLVVGLTEEDFSSLTQAQIEKYTKQFLKSELFFRIGSQIVSVSVDS